MKVVYYNNSFWIVIDNKVITMFDGSGDSENDEYLIETILEAGWRWQLAINGHLQSVIDTAFDIMDANVIYFDATHAIDKVNEMEIEGVDSDGDALRHLLEHYAHLFDVDPINNAQSHHINPDLITVRT